MTFAVCVTIRLRPGAFDSFMPMMLENARQSLADEAECLRFDVLQNGDQPEDVFLYEIYSSPEAFEAHLKTPHFLTFDAATRKLIAEKLVKTYGTVHS